MGKTPGVMDNYHPHYYVLGNWITPWNPIPQRGYTGERLGHT